MTNADVFIDIHTHHQASIIHNHLIVKSLKAGEALVETEAHAFSAGIHPWQLNHHPLNELKDRLLLQLQHPKIVAIGEAGIDKIIPIPLDLQIEVFRWHIDISQQMKLPLIIHSVRGDAEILQWRKRTGYENHWILHGFRGGSEKMAQLVKNQIMLSFGAAITLQQPKLMQSLQAIPSDYLLLETDQSETSIEDIYQKAALQRRCTIQELQQIIYENCRRLFSQCFTLDELP